jgi:uncharacterized RDD family membrane protein YckC
MPGYRVGPSSMAGEAATGGLAAGIAAGDTGNYGGFWLRFVAALIDGIALSAAMFIFGLLGGIFGVSLTSLARPDATAKMWGAVGFLQLIAFVGVWLYFALMESSAWQATLGKKVLGLYVTDLEGRRLGFGRATGRYFAKAISNFTLLIGYIIAGFTKKKQALHDIIAGCLVLRNA